MNEIHGFGPLQPLRPTGSVFRMQGPAPSAEVNSPVLQDEVTLQADAGAIAEAPVQAPAATPSSAPASPAVPAAEVAAYYTPDGGVMFGSAGTRSVESFDGFLVASQTQGNARVASLAPSIAASGMGPIAMIDEPSPEPAGVEFPDLSLNGPSTASEGFFGLSGRRLA